MYQETVDVFSGRERIRLGEQSDQLKSPYMSDTGDGKDKPAVGTASLLIYRRISDPAPVSRTLLCGYIPQGHFRFMARRWQIEHPSQPERTSGHSHHLSYLLRHPWPASDPAIEGTLNKYIIHIITIVKTK